MESVAVNKYHTPYLYSIFLRALLASKKDGSRPATPQAEATHVDNSGDAGPALTLNDTQLDTNGLSMFGNGPYSPSRGGASQMQNDPFGLEMYKYMGENYGDMSGFVNPFTMASPGQSLMDTPTPFSTGVTMGTDQSGPMSLDSLFNSGFWDSMLVPGVYSQGLSRLVLTLWKDSPIHWKVSVEDLFMDQVEVDLYQDFIPQVVLAVLLLHLLNLAGHIMVQVTWVQ